MNDAVVKTAILKVKQCNIIWLAISIIMIIAGLPHSYSEQDMVLE